MTYSNYHDRLAKDEMKRENPPFLQTPANQQVPVWRYMDFTKFVALLELRALYFPRVDVLDDKLEGSVSLATIIARKDLYRRLSPTWSIGRTVEEFLEGRSSLYQRLRKLTYVNCWHLNDDESAAMWQLYAPSGKGVAIKTTFEKLSRSIPEDYNEPYTFWCGLVNYANFQTSEVPDEDLRQPFMFKRKSFEHEKEIRVVVQHEFDSCATDPNLPTYKFVSVSPKDLIEAIHLSPGADHLYADLVKRIAHREGLDVSKVHQSEIDSPALH